MMKSDFFLDLRSLYSDPHFCLAKRHIKIFRYIVKKLFIIIFNLIL
jgi:hypothetical protein